MMVSRLKRPGNKSAICAALVSLIVSQQASAAAFSIKEQSVTYLGTAYSGTASSSIDASSNYYNPAGLSELKHDQIMAGAVYIHGYTKLYNAVATNTIGGAVTGNVPTKPKATAWIPSTHAAWRYDKNWVLGFSICAPFGLSTIYNAGDMARFVAIKSKITSVDFSPGVSYRVNDQFSLGLALDEMYVKATLSNDAQRPGGIAFISNEASGWVFGYHLGVLYKPSCNTKMGLTYFSKFTPRVQGNVTSFNPSSPIKQSVSSQFSLPDRIVYSITHDYDEKWSAMADIEWDHWTRTKYLRLEYNTGQSSLEYFYYRNTWRFAVGTNYKYNKCMIIKGGLSYEQTPTNDVYRSARLPEGNRYWLGLGVDYAFNKNISLDVAYAYILNKKTSVNQRQVGTAATLRGDYRNSANLFGVQLKWNFV